METRDTYKNIVTKEILTEEEKKLLDERKDYIKNACEYIEYMPHTAQEYVEDYKREITFLASLKEEEKNETIKTEIQKAQEIFSTPSKLKQEEHNINNNLILAKKREDARQRHAGYTNATILIFLVANLGLFLATLLLLTK